MLGQCWLPTLGLRKYARRIYVGPTSICQHRVRWRMVGCWLLSNVHTNHTWQQEAYQTLWYCQGHKALAWGGSRAHKPPVKLERNRFFCTVVLGIKLALFAAWEQHAPKRANLPTPTDVHPQTRYQLPGLYSGPRWGLCPRHMLAPHYMLALAMSTASPK